MFKLKELMQYENIVGFQRARDALAAWCEITGEKIKIPTNCCPALLPFASELVPVDPETGLAPVPVQLYGYRQVFPGAKLEIDPLMTGLLGQPFAESCIVSFGYAKTIDIGGGGAILTQDISLYRELIKRDSFPPILENPLVSAINNIHETIMEKKKEYEEIESIFCNMVERIERPIIPWRFVARVFEPFGDEDDKFHFSFENELFSRAHEMGYKASKNYPPLPGVTDPGAIEWGEKVINIWK